MNHYLQTRIAALQQELSTLQTHLSRQTQGDRRTTQLQGLWEGIKIDGADFELARQAVCRDADAAGFANE